jgi:hypothetical protein
MGSLTGNPEEPSIKNDILAASAKRRTWRFEDLYYELLFGSWFGIIQEKDFRKACKDLHATGQIERLSEGKAWDNATLLRIIPEPGVPAS